MGVQGSINNNILKAVSSNARVEGGVQGSMIQRSLEINCTPNGQQSRDSNPVHNPD